MTETDPSNLANTADDRISYEESAKKMLLRHLDKKLDIQAEEAI